MRNYKIKPVVALSNNGKSFIFNSISEAARFIRSQDPAKTNHKNRKIRSIRRNITLALDTLIQTYGFFWKNIKETNPSQDMYHDQELTNLVNRKTLQIICLLPDGSIKEFNSFKSTAQYFYTYIFKAEHEIDFILNKIRNAYIYNKMKTKNPFYYALGYTFFDESFFIRGNF